MLSCHMRYLKLVRRLTRTDDLWELDNADRHCAGLAQKLDCSTQSILRGSHNAALLRKYYANWRMRALSLYGGIWIFYIFGEFF